MEEEKRGPVEKGIKGWPVNPFGVAALVVFAIIVAFFIIRPLLSQKSQNTNPLLPANSSGGNIVSPDAGAIVKSQNLKIELSVDEPQNVDKVQFWAKTYADGKWQMIGEITKAPYQLDWQIPREFQNRAIAITSHIYTKDAKVIKDPGGWREGIILLNNQ